MADSITSMFIKISGKEYSQEKIKEIFQSISSSDYYDFEYVKNDIKEDSTDICFEEMTGPTQDEVDSFFYELTDLIKTNFKDISVIVECAFYNMYSSGTYKHAFYREHLKDINLWVEVPNDYLNTAVCPECGEEIDIDVSFSDWCSAYGISNNLTLGTCKNCSTEFTVENARDYIWERDHYSEIGYFEEDVE